MPTFFSRRYMRRLREVGITEKRLGVLLLLLLAVIVAGFVWQSSTNTGYLFEAGVTVDESGGDAHALAVGKKLLPALGAEWKAGDVEVMSGDDLAEAEPPETKAYQAFGARHLYRRHYVNVQPPSGRLAVTICDVNTPAQAFGLMCTRRPDGAGPLSVVRGGWKDGTLAGFWKGRYYTELHLAPETAEATRILRDGARQIAAVQLDYGRSFWAESLLPPEGRVQGSLRYVHRDALGLSPLDEVFLVELAGGTTAWVMDAATPSKAAAVVEQLQREAAYGGVELSGPLTMVPINDGTLAVFAAGQFVHGAWGTGAAGVEATAMSAFALASGVEGISAARAPRGSAPQAEAGGTRPFPDPDISAWRAPGAAARFTPENLYEKINGRAALYLQFHVVGLTFGTYFHQSDRGRTIDVYWYDMGEPANALGVYRSEAPPDAAPADVGAQGYHAGSAVFFTKGPHYVQVLPAGPDEDDGQVALKIAERIDAEIQGDDQNLWAQKILPEIGRVADSFEYLADDAFSLDFLNDVFTAEYDMHGGRVKLFVHKSEDETAARALFDRYRAFFGEYGEVVWTAPAGSRRMMAGNAGGVIDVVFTRGMYLGGVAGAEDLEIAKQAAAAFYDGLGAADAEVIEADGP